MCPLVHLAPVWLIRPSQPDLALLDAPASTSRQNCEVSWAEAILVSALGSHHNGHQDGITRHLLQVQSRLLPAMSRRPIFREAFHVRL
jgi:hypothetical protein